MGAGAINPFYTATQSTPMSHFVDESLPIDLMLRAGVMKQGQYDQTQQMLDMLGSFDQAALPGRDTEYVDAVKEDVNKFVESNIGRDLSDNAIARDAFRFATKIRQDKSLKTARENLAAVQQFKEDARELDKKSKKFLPSYYTGLQQIKGYTEGKGQVSSIGDLIVNEALDRRQAREAFFNNASESFHEDFKKVGDLIMKVGVGGISAEQIQNLAALGFNDYMASKAGQQDVDYYDYLVKTGQTPTDRFGKPITDGSRYVLDQMVRTGLERVNSKSTISFNKGLNEALGAGLNPPGDGVKTNTGVNTKDLDYENLLELAESGQGAASNEARTILAQIHDKMDKNVKISGFREKIEALTSGNKVYSEDGKTVRADNTINGQKLPSKKQISDVFKGYGLPEGKNLNNLVSYMQNNLLNLVAKEASAGNTTFLDNLTRDNMITGPGVDFGTGARSYPFGSITDETGIKFQGSTEKFTWKEMGIDPETSDGKAFINASMRQMDGIIGAALNQYISEEGKTEDRSTVWYSDAIDGIKQLAYDIKSERDGLVEGTAVRPQKVWYPLDAKLRKEMSGIFGADNFDSNYKVWDPEKREFLNPEDSDYRVFKGNVANENNFTTRLGVEGGKFFEVTTKPKYTSEGVPIKNSVKKYRVQEIPGTRSQVMEKVYNNYLGKGTYNEATAVEGLQTLRETSKNITSIQGFNELFTPLQSIELDKKGLGLKINDYTGYSSYSNILAPSIFTYGNNQTVLTTGKVLKDLSGATLQPKSAATFAKILSENLMYTRPKVTDPKEDTKAQYFPPSDEQPKGGIVYQALYNNLIGTATNSQKTLLSALKTKPILGYNDVNQTKNLTLLLLGTLKVD